MSRQEMEQRRYHEEQQRILEEERRRYDAEKRYEDMRSKQNEHTMLAPVIPNRDSVSSSGSNSTYGRVIDVVPPSRSASQTQSQRSHARTQSLQAPTTPSGSRHSPLRTQRAPSISNTPIAPDPSQFLSPAAPPLQPLPSNGHRRDETGPGYIHKRASSLSQSNIGIPRGPPPAGFLRGPAADGIPRSPWNAAHRNLDATPARPDTPTDIVAPASPAPVLEEPEEWKWPTPGSAAAAKLDKGKGKAVDWEEMKGAPVLVHYPDGRVVYPAGQGKGQERGRPGGSGGGGMGRRRSSRSPGPPVLPIPVPGSHSQHQDQQVFPSSPGFGQGQGRSASPAPIPIPAPGAGAGAGPSLSRQPSLTSIRSRASRASYSKYDAFDPDKYTDPAMWGQGPPPPLPPKEGNRNHNRSSTMSGQYLSQQHDRTSGHRRSASSQQAPDLFGTDYVVRTGVGGGAASQWGQGYGPGSGQANYGQWENGVPTGPRPPSSSMFGYGRQRNVSEGGGSRKSGASGVSFVLPPGHNQRQTRGQSPSRLSQGRDRPPSQAASRNSQAPSRSSRRNSEVPSQPTAGHIFKGSSMFGGLEGGGRTPEYDGKGPFPKGLRPWAKIPGMP